MRNPFKELVKRLPPIARILAERDQLQVSCDRLQGERDRLRAQVEQLLAKKPSYLVTRAQVVKEYLKGEGVEIGALHQATELPPTAKVKYVDRLAVPELRKLYPELKDHDFVNVDILDDGETLSTIADASLDFVIANHLLEHCEDPVKAVLNMLRVLKEDGILFLSVPEKDAAFDKDRPVTSLQHVARDHEEGPEASRREHFEEWVRLVQGVKDAAEIEKQVRHLMKIDYSIHYHVWSMSALVDFLVSMRRDFGAGFDEELVVRNESEIVVVLKKRQATVV